MTLYFLSGSKRYDIENLKGDIQYIIQEGWEVGLHGSLNAFNDLNHLRKEKALLENIAAHNVIGYRSHYLNLLLPRTWEILEKAGFKYDTTFGYPDMVGFRNGMCHPFRPFNCLTERTMDIVEIPLTIMDGTLFSYMHLDDTERWRFCRALIDATEKYNGVITLLWHNLAFSGLPNRKSWQELYERILDYCANKNAWMASAREIYEWWAGNLDD